MYSKASIGQDSHRFCDTGSEEAARKPLVLGGVVFRGGPPLMGNSDADVVLHALCNAISGITGVNILGGAADRMCLDEGVTDSAEYVKEAMKHLSDCRIAHISFSIECARPAISPGIVDMKEYVAKLAGIGADSVCITATSGEGLTDFGRGLGIAALCVLTVICGYTDETPNT